MLILDAGRIAVRLQLHQPGRRLLERTLTAYHADPDVVAALYLVTTQPVFNTVQTTAANLGLSDLTRVQRAQFGETPPAELAT